MQGERGAASSAGHRLGSPEAAGSLPLGALKRPGAGHRKRGNLKQDKPRLEPLGSIPACAGEPSRSNWTTPTSGVYPRVCGGTPKRTTRGS